MSAGIASCVHRVIACLSDLPGPATPVAPWGFSLYGSWKKPLTWLKIPGSLCTVLRAATNTSVHRHSTVLNDSRSVSVGGGAFTSSLMAWTISTVWCLTFSNRTGSISLDPHRCRQTKLTSNTAPSARGADGGAFLLFTLGCCVGAV